MHDAIGACLGPFCSIYSMEQAALLSWGERRPSVAERGGSDGQHQILRYFHQIQIGFTRSDFNLLSRRYPNRI